MCCEDPGNVACVVDTLGQRGGPRDIGGGEGELLRVAAGPENCLVAGAERERQNETQRQNLLRGSHMPLHLLAACDALWDFVQMSWIVNLLELPISGHQKSVNRDVSRSTGAVAVRSHDVALGVDAP